MFVRPATVFACLAASAVALGACGGAAHRAAPPPPVRLALQAPGDLAVVRAGAVTLRGRVRPGQSSVLVRGRRAAVAAGVFSARVGLEPGINVIDVMASARGSRPAFATVRVRRQVVATVPDLAGATARDAAHRLRALDLAVRAEDVGGFLDGLVPGAPTVCRTRPAAGSVVDVGSTVTVQTAHLC
jgi:Glucodextranase, domain B/PASTA domain